MDTPQPSLAELLQKEQQERMEAGHVEIGAVLEKYRLRFTFGITLHNNGSIEPYMNLIPNEVQ